MQNAMPIGLVLAGGASSRMGSNKAALQYKGTPLVKHMMSVLGATGIDRIYVSGEIEGYDCLKDNEPLSGPARAIIGVLSKLDLPSGLLVVPVDMPLLKAETLSLLLKHSNGAYFRGFPLPAYIREASLIGTSTHSVRSLLQQTGAEEISLPDHLLATMKNVNTPQDWGEINGHEC